MMLIKRLIAELFFHFVRWREMYIKENLKVKFSVLFVFLLPKFNVAK